MAHPRSVSRFLSETVRKMAAARGSKSDGLPAIELASGPGSIEEGDAAEIDFEHGGLISHVKRVLAEGA